MPNTPHPLHGNISLVMSLQSRNTGFEEPGQRLCIFVKDYSQKIQPEDLLPILSKFVDGYHPFYRTVRHPVEESHGQKGDILWNIPLYYKNDSKYERKYIIRWQNQLDGWLNSNRSVDVNAILKSVKAVEYFKEEMVKITWTSWQNVIKKMRALERSDTDITMLFRRYNPGSLHSRKRARVE